MGIESGVVARLNTITDLVELGPELVTNGTFTGNADGWTLGTGWAYGTNNVVATAATGDVTQPISGLISGATYQASYTISGYVDGSYALRIYNGSFGVDATTRTANGTYTENLTLNVASGAAASVRVVTVVDGTATIDNISVVEVSRPRGAIKRKRRRIRYYEPWEYELGDPFNKD